MHQGCAALGDPASAVRNRLRSVARRCIAIRLQSRREEHRPALVRSYRRLTSTTYAVLRDAATMVRRVGQRVPAAPYTHEPRRSSLVSPLHLRRARLQSSCEAELKTGSCPPDTRTMKRLRPRLKQLLSWAYF
jgi:hypothetical protein